MWSLDEIWDDLVSKVHAAGTACYDLVPSWIELPTEDMVEQLTKLQDDNSFNLRVREEGSTATYHRVMVSVGEDLAKDKIRVHGEKGSRELLL